MYLSAQSLAAPAIALLMLAAAAQPVSVPKPADQALAPYASVADSIKLRDGRELHFVCMGKGSPTVVLTAGMGDFAGMAWSTVQPAMARTTRVCAWDRPGFGLSDGDPIEQTVATTTADLEAALAQGRIRGPYVMVGHSLGSYESLLFADRHTKDVVGMVLVDPSVPDQLALEQRIAPLFAQEDSAEQPLVKIYRRCAADMRAGTAKDGGPDPDHCLAYPPFFPAALSKALRAKVTNPVQYETMASFMTSFAQDAKIVVNPGRNYGDMPLVVLTATVRTLPPGASDEERAENSAFDVAFNAAHDQLASLSTRGINARVPGANHYIQRSRPQAVIDAVAAVVTEARDRKSR